MFRFATAIAASLLFTGAAFAGTDFNFPAFTGINVHGGAHVILRHGAVQKVTVTKGDLTKADLHIAGNTLDITPCKELCINVKPLEVVIESPKIEAIEAHGGGAVDTAGDFPKQALLNLEAHGGGAINVTAIAADTVNAQAHGGGDINLTALSVLNAQAHGGGAINYRGNPRVSAQTHGGGAINKD